MLLPTPKVRTRTSAPKSRNGCLTCRARRVKCDESRPRCKQCIVSRRSCQWKTAPTRGQPIKLLPNNASQLSQSEPSQTLHFTDPRDLYYFRIYQDEVASELATFHVSSPWTYTILRACYTERFVRRAVVAIGALSKSIKTEHLTLSLPLAMKEANLITSKQHRDFALAAYDQAIAAMRQINSRPQDPASLRNALMASLLILCFEWFIGSPNTAWVQGNLGSKLLRQFASRPHRDVGIASPDSRVVDEELFHEFTRLDTIHATIWGDHPIKYHHEARQEGTSTVENMPAQFANLDQAKVYQELIIKRARHLVGEIYGRIIAEKEFSGHAFTADSPGELVDPCYIPEMILEVRETYLNDIRRWCTIYDPILKISLTSRDARTSLGAAILKIQALDSEIALAGTLFTEECSFDGYLPHAQEIVALSRIVVEKRKQLWATSPIFDILPTLEIALQDVAMACRDKDVRFEALAILRSQASQDSTKLRYRKATRASYLIALEEQGRDVNGYIPESARYRRIWVLNHYNENPFSVTLICARRIGYPLGTAYPADREYQWKIFAPEEAESILPNEEYAKPNYRPWSLRGRKPLFLKWEELHKELKERVPNSSWKRTEYRTIMFH